VNRNLQKGSRTKLQHNPKKSKTDRYFQMVLPCMMALISLWGTHLTCHIRVC